MITITHYNVDDVPNSDVVMTHTRVYHEVVVLRFVLVIQLHDVAPLSLRGVSRTADVECDTCHISRDTCHISRDTRAAAAAASFTHAYALLSSVSRC